MRLFSYRLWLAAATGTVMLLSGCTSHQKAEITPPSPTDDVLPTQYQCQQNESLRVDYFPGQEKAQLHYHGQTITLAQQPMASGFAYTDGQLRIQGKGPALTLQWPDNKHLTCQALINP